MRSLLFLTLAALLPVSIAAQEKKARKVEPVKVVKLDRKEPVVYEKDIEPIFVNKCLFCHSGAVKEGKFDMATYEALVKGGRTGAAIVPGKSAESLLVRLCGRAEARIMPPRSEEPLTPEELALVKLWIDEGAKPPTGVREKPRPTLTALPPSIQPVRALAISPDKAQVAAGRANQIHIYEVASGNHLRSLVDPTVVGPDQKPLDAAHMSIVESLAYSPDGQLLASGSYQEVTLWDVATGTVKQKLTGFADRVMALAFDKDGKLLATGGGAPTEDGEVKVFEVATGKLVTDLKSGHSDTVFGVTFSPDGKMLATCGADKFVKTWELPEGKFIKSFEGHTHHVLDVGWRGDGKVLASAGADNNIKVWDFEKGEQVRTIGGHNKQVTRLLFVGTTPQIETCSGDQNVRMINVDNGGNIRNFAGGTDFLYAVGVTADGSLVASGGEEGVVRLYNGANGQLLKTLVPPGAEAKK
jgi:WD40 repeat protein